MSQEDDVKDEEEEEEGSSHLLAHARSASSSGFVEFELDLFGVWSAVTANVPTLKR